MAQFLQAIALMFICNLGQCYSCTNVTLNCTSEVSSFPCHELACLKVHWSVMMPYAYLLEGEGNKTTPYGILIGVTKTLLEQCCGACWSIRETPPVNFTVFHETEPEDAGLSFPYIVSAVDRQLYDEHYIPIIKDPSSAFVQKKEGWKALLKNLLSVIYGSWPVLVTALLFSWISGMIIWFLEMWFNHEEFPRKFLTGSWEGFWWAVVSMTTVGYGDRAPRSLPGRVFAIFWILIGICVCSIFTATLTSALTMNKFDGQQTLARIKVGVVENSMEAITAIQNQADVFYYNTTEELWDAIYYDDVDGILLDYYYAQLLEVESIIESNDLVTVSVFKPKDWSIGISLPGRKELVECLRKAYDHDYARILYDAIPHEDISRTSEIESGSQMSGIFDPEGEMFKMILYISCAGACCMFICGLCWDFIRRGRKIGCKLETNKKLDAIEKELVSDLQAVITSWKERMSERGGPFELEKKA